MLIFLIKILSQYQIYYVFSCNKKIFIKKLFITPFLILIANFNCKIAKKNLFPLIPYNLKADKMFFFLPKIIYEPSTLTANN